MSSALSSFFLWSQVHGCFRHLALPKLRQKDIIYRSFSTSGADDWFPENGSHGLVVDPDCPNVTIEFFLTPLTFKVDLHLVSLCFLANILNNLHNHPKASTQAVVAGSFSGYMTLSAGFSITSTRWSFPSS